MLLNPRKRWECEKRWRMASTTITDPSTIKPKSIAPKLIRLPPTPNIFIRITANSMDNGITDDTINPALILPRKNTSTNTTISAPSIRLCSTVSIALFTILVRSRNGSITTPWGNDFWIWWIFALQHQYHRAGYLALIVIGHCSIADSWAKAHFGYITH